MNRKEWNARIGACAVLLRADKSVKVAQIAENRSIPEDEAARMYVVGALKASVRRGTANSLGEALERFESDQVGDRSVSVHGEPSIAREVRRINIANETRGGKATTHRRNMGKVLGTLYVEWDAQIAESSVDVVLELEGREAVALHAESVITAYIEDYISRLSTTARASIRDIVKSAYSVDAIMSGKDEGAYKLRERAKFLHRNFPKAQGSTRET